MSESANQSDIYSRLSDLDKAGAESAAQLESQGGRISNMENVMTVMADTMTKGFANVSLEIHASERSSRVGPGIWVAAVAVGLSFIALMTSLFMTQISQVAGMHRDETVRQAAMHERALVEAAVDDRRELKDAYDDGRRDAKIQAIEGGLNWIVRGWIRPGGGDGE
jgi:hypothetical protein